MVGFMASALIVLVFTAVCAGALYLARAPILFVIFGAVLLGLWRSAAHAAGLTEGQLALAVLGSLGVCAVVWFVRTEIRTLRKQS
jgi:hypothetical protein